MNDNDTAKNGVDVGQWRHKKYVRAASPLSGLSFFKKTNNKWSYTLVSRHWPHCICWSWAIGLSFHWPKANRYFWKPVFYRHGTGGFAIFRFGLGNLSYRWQNNDWMIKDF